jgi:hypothetical protein
MASKALKVTYAAATAKKAGIKTPLFAKTVCKLRVPDGYPTRKVPTTNEKFSLFVDLNGQKEEEVAAALSKLSVAGAIYREDLKTLELVFGTEEEMKTTLVQKIETESGKKVALMLPRHYVRKMVYVRVANMPLGEENVLKEELQEHWKQYGEVLDIGIHKMKATGWNTRRWDLLVGLKEEKTTLDAPVAFELLGRKLVAAWPGSAPSCLVCQNAGHNAKKCPTKNPKLVDPENKVGRTTKVVPGTKKSTEVAQGVTEEISDTIEKQIGDKSNPEEDLQTGETSTEMIGKKTSPTAEVVESDEKSAEMEDVMEELPSTPPQQLIETITEQDTPKKGNKRMSKDDLTRRYPVPNWFPADIKQMMEQNNVCGHCLVPHDGKKCQSPEEWIEGDPEQDMPKYYKLIRENFGKSKRPRRRKAEQSKQTPGTGPEINVPAWCEKCRKIGHNKSECKCPDCRRCGSGDHIGRFCSVGGTYAYEQ